MTIWIMTIPVVMWTDYFVHFIVRIFVLFFLNFFFNFGGLTERSERSILNIFKNFHIRPKKNRLIMGKLVRK